MKGKETKRKIETEGKMIQKIIRAEEGKNRSK
jgi:hypothetical protein